MPQTTGKQRHRCAFTPVRCHPLSVTPTDITLGLAAKSPIINVENLFRAG